MGVNRGIWGIVVSDKQIPNKFNTQSGDPEDFASLAGSLMLRVLDLDAKVSKIELSHPSDSIQKLKDDVAHLRHLVSDGGETAILSMLKNLEARIKVAEKTSTENKQWRERIEKSVKRIFWIVVALSGGTVTEQMPGWFDALVELLKKVGGTTP